MIAAGWRWCCAAYGCSASSRSPDRRCSRSSATRSATGADHNGQLFDGLDKSMAFGRRDVNRHIALRDGAAGEPGMQRVIRNAVDAILFVPLHGRKVLVASLDNHM